MTRFATWDRKLALKFLQGHHPSWNLEDTPERAGPVLDLVEENLFLIVDPRCRRGEITIGQKWDPSRGQECLDTLLAMDPEGEELNK